MVKLLCKTGRERNLYVLDLMRASGIISLFPEGAVERERLWRKSITQKWG